MRLPTVITALGLALGAVAAVPSAAQAIDPSQIPPIANADTLAATEAHTLVISESDLLANDAGFGGSAISVFDVSSAAHGTVTTDVAGGVWSATYTSVSGFSGPDTFTYTLTNTKGKHSLPATVTVDVSANAAPVVPAGGRSVGSGQLLRLDPVELMLDATDPDGDPLWVSFLFGLGAAHGTFTPYVGPDKVTYGEYRSADGFVGTDQIGYVVHDSFGQSTLGVLTVAVLPVPVVEPTVPGTGQPVANAGQVLVSATSLHARPVRRGHRGLITGAFGTHSGVVQVQVRSARGTTRVFRVTTAADGSFRLVVPRALGTHAGRNRVTVSYVADPAFAGARTYSLSYAVKNRK